MNFLFMPVFILIIIFNRTVDYWTNLFYLIDIKRFMSSLKGLNIVILAPFF